MLDLGKIREEIDEIDNEIVRLFLERMGKAEQVAQYKIETGKPVLDPLREAEKLSALGGLGDSDFNRLGIRELFGQVMSISRKRQYQLLTQHHVGEDADYIQVDSLPVQGAKVVFQGLEGAYSFAAMKTFFDDSILSFHVATWKEAMDAVSRGDADYAVLPIENSTAGSVSDIYDLLVEYPHFIVGEQIIPIEHVLMGVPGASLTDITEVYSHPQSLAQCRNYLRKHEDWEQKTVLNNAVAAQKVAADKDRTHAAIASRHAAEHFGLEVLAEKISNSSTNATRFVIVSGKKQFAKNAGKISICIELPHECGSLYHILSHLMFNNLNMTKIESRPIPQRNWEYRFIIDFVGNLSDPAVENALRGIRQEATMLHVFGNY